MSNLIKKFRRNEDGATAIEYGLIAGLIAVAVITVLATLGPKVAAQFTAIEGKLPTTASDG